MAKRNTDSFNPYHQWLGIPEKNCPPTHYELLGISLDEDDLGVINSAAERQKSHVEQFLGTEFNKYANKLIGQIDEAEIILTSPELRREYDRKVNLFKKRRKKRQIDPAITSSIISGGGRSVGEGSGFVREYAGIVSILLVAFMVMAAFTFKMPWQKVVFDKENDDTPAAPVVVDDVKLNNIKTSGEIAIAPDTLAQPKNVVTLPKPVLSITFDEPPNSGLRLDNRGATFVAGKVGKAMKCDGKGFMVVPAQLPAGNAPRTISVWLRSDGGEVVQNRHAIAYGGDTSPPTVLGIYHTKDEWETYGWGKNAIKVADIDDNWHHHCLTCDGEEIICRFDGKIVSKEKGTLKTTAGPLVLGTYANQNTYFCFKGLIDEVSIYDTALSSEQVQQLIESQDAVADKAKVQNHNWAQFSLSDRIRDRDYPSVFQAWNPADNLLSEDKLQTLSRHDLVWNSPSFFGLRWDGTNRGIASEFIEDSIPAAKSMRSSLLKMNPRMVFIAEIRYRDAPPQFLPENHKWWARDKQGMKRKGWSEGGYYRLDFADKEFQRHVASRAKSAVESGVFDGVLLDWWGDDSDRISLVQTIRNAIGKDYLIIVNANARTTPKTAPYINGYFMECTKSKTSADWKEIISTLRWAEENLLPPRVNCVETWYHQSRDDLSLMRSVTTLSLTLSNGYCLFSDPNQLPTPDHRHNWYPFWDKPLGKPISNGVRRSDGSYVREFEHGIAVFNPMGNHQVTVTFEKSQKSMKTGKHLASHTIPPGDGDLFLGSSRLASNKTATTPVNHDANVTIRAIAKSVKVDNKGEPVALDLTGVQLTESQLAQIATLSSLRRLTVPNTKLTDVGLQKLGTLTNLTSLGMWQTRITDEGLQHVNKLTNLTYLSVDGNGRRITNEGLAHLSDLRKLSWLCLSYTGVTDNGMHHLTKLPSLQRLDIHHTEISDQGLKDIMQIKTLKTLDVRGTAITKSGIQKLKRALPKCKIIY